MANDRKCMRDVAPTDSREDASSLAVRPDDTWRKMDDVLLPTRGRVLKLQTGVGHARSDPGGQGPFASVYRELLSFWPLGSWHGRTRLELGQVFAERRDSTRASAIPRRR